MHSAALILFFSAFIGMSIETPYGGLVAVSDCTSSKEMAWRYDSNTNQIINSNGKCLEVQSGVAEENQPVQLYTCQKGNSPNQQWTYDKSTKQIIGLSGFCLGVKNACMASGSLISLHYCDESASTRWELSGNQIVSLLNKQCLLPAGKPELGAMDVPLIIGHRGYPAEFPENTMASFRGAINAGADGIETDLRLTKDGYIVLSHDASLARRTNCTGNVEDYTYEYIINNCDAGVKDGARWAGNFVPTFEDAVKLCKDADVLMVMDMKVDGLGTEINRILTKYKYKRAIASMWFQTQLDEMKRTNPTVPRQRLTEDLTNSTAAFFASEVKQGVMGYSMDKKILTSTFVNSAHRALMNVVTWTVDSIQDVKKAVRAGVNGIITNDCEQALWVATDLMKPY